MKRDLLARRAASAALTACMMFTLSAPALAAAPALPEFYSAAKVLEQTNDAETAVSNEFSLSNGRLYINAERHNYQCDRPVGRYRRDLQ